MKKMEFTRKQAWELLWDGVAFLAGSFFVCCSGERVYRSQQYRAGGIDRIGNND